MRIAMIGWEYPPFKVGGLGTHCYRLTRALADLNVKIDFYMPKLSSSKPENTRNLRIKEVGVTRVFPYDKPYEQPIEGGFFESVYMYNRLCSEKIKGCYDLVHCHDWLTIQAGVTVKKRLGIPLVFTVHSTEYDRCGGIYPNEWFINIEREGMENADRVIAVSNFTKKIIVEKYGISEGKVRVVHNAVSPIGEGEKSKIVLFLGRLTIQKGPEFFLRAAKRVLEEEDCLFVVAGSGDMLPQLISLAVDLGIAHKVMFTGSLTDDEVKHIYRIASVYVLPSVSEPFGITALEAVSAGTPTIVSKTAGVSEVLKNCLLVDFWDTEEMANKIVALLRYKPLHKTLRENAKKEVAFFTWDVTAKKTLEVYKEVV
ncbi:MAG TPA: glycosyltransferase family 1 protein [Thermoplasmata archaeon]|nr:glycosyltransferase family 1 protein [Thermoplasmata archaeon]